CSLASCAAVVSATVAWAEKSCGTRMWRKRLRRAIAISFPAGFCGPRLQSRGHPRRPSQPARILEGGQTPEFRGIRMTSPIEAEDPVDQVSRLILLDVDRIR